jgi:ABC-type transport system involved in multi-copper enzyme maturation permease subunit
LPQSNPGWFMFGPVFFLELRLAVRRGRLNTFRYAYAGWCLLQFALLFALLFQSETQPASLGVGLSPALHGSFHLLVAQQFIFLVLVTPAFVAGAITDEKSQGTLQHLLTADLTSWEIILGKFLGRVAQVTLVAITGWPLLFFLGGYAHVGLPALCATIVLSGVILFVEGAVSVWASVCSKQTRQAVLRVYAWSAIILLTICGGPQAIRALSGPFKPGPAGLQKLSQVEGILHSLDPLSVLDSLWPQDDLGEFLSRLEVMLPVYGGIGLLCLALAIWRFRATYIRELEVAGRETVPLFSAWRGTRPEVGDDPVRWRETTTVGRLPRWLAVGLLAALSCASSAAIVYSQEPTLFILQGVVFLFLASLVAGVRTSGAITGERERQTWDSLLLTPLDTWDLIMDKANGALDILRPYFAAFAVPAALLALWMGAAAIIATLSLLLLTWAAIYYMAATGIWCSVRSKGSWQSLVATLTTGYGYLLGILFLFSLVYFWFSCGIGSFIVFFLTLVGLTNLSFAVWIILCIPTCVGASWFLWKASFPKLDKARAWVDEHERYGRTFVRSLASALRTHYRRLEERKRRGGEVVGS